MTLSRINFRLLLPVLLLVLGIYGAFAQGTAPFRLRTPEGYIAAVVDGSGNLALRGTAASGDTTITLSAGTLEWHVSSGSTILALIPLSGPAAGSMRLRGAVHAGSSPSGSHPWVFRAGGMVVASMTSAGELYLLGQLQEQALVPPAAPELLSVSALSTSSLELEWSDVAGEDGYRIEWSLSGAGGWMPLATSPSPIPAGTTAWTAGGLSPGTHYYFRVRSENEYGPSAPSNVLDGRTLGGEAGYEDYTYDGWRVLEAYEDGASGPKRQWVYGNYIDEPLVMDVDADADGNCIGGNDNRYFYHQNLNYSVVGLTDVTGQLVEAYEYTPYGEHIGLSDGDSDGKVEFDSTDIVSAPGAQSMWRNPYLFAGKQLDEETGLHNIRLRYLDNQGGRFLSRDPIGQINSLNLYTYVDNNPVSYTDIFGLQKLGIAFLGFTQKIDYSDIKGDWGELVKSRATRVFTSREEWDAVSFIIDMIDKNKNKKIDKCDATYDIRIVGYSWGAVTAVHVAIELDQKKAKAEAPEKLDVNVLGLLDPVGSFRINPKVPGNVKSATNYYQRFGLRGILPNITFRGMPINGAQNTDVSKYKDGKVQDTPDHSDLGYINYGGYALKIAQMLE